MGKGLRRGPALDANGDSFHFERFITAQSQLVDRVRDELRAGRKQSHWMWFIFPQIAGLGFSAMAQRYAIASLDEAKAYLVHPVLGPRLKECTALVNAVQEKSAHGIFGSPDDLKFRSSMTLFHAADPDAPEFREALGKYFGGVGDPATLEKL